MMHVRFPLSLRQVEDLLSGRGIDICHETVRYWWNRFGPLFAAVIRKCRVHCHWYSNWRWHLDEVFVRINRKTCCLWRAVDHEGEVLLATKRRDRWAALGFLKTRDEALWPAGVGRHGRATVLPGCDDCDRQCGRPDQRSLAQQPDRELAPAVQTTGSGNGQFQGRKDPAEICFRPCLDPQPFQPRTSSQPPRNFQTKPGRHLGRVASIGGLRPFDCRFYKSCPVRLTMPLPLLQPSQRLAEESLRCLRVASR